jgi:hypothetical protein
MIKAIGNHSQSKRLNFRDGLRTSLPLYHDPGKVGHFGNPATIAFTLDLNLHWLVLLVQYTPPSSRKQEGHCFAEP